MFVTLTVGSDYAPQHSVRPAYIALEQESKDYFVA